MGWDSTGALMRAMVLTAVKNLILRLLLGMLY